MSAGCNKMQELNLGWCKGMTDDDVRALHGMSSLTNLQLSRTSVSSCLPEGSWSSLGVWVELTGAPVKGMLAPVAANESPGCAPAGRVLVGSSQPDATCLPQQEAGVACPCFARKGRECTQRPKCVLISFVHGETAAWRFHVCMT